MQFKLELAKRKWCAIKTVDKHLEQVKFATFNVDLEHVNKVAISLDQDSYEGFFGKRAMGLVERTGDHITHLYIHTMYPFHPSSESESNYPTEYPGSATEQQNIGQGGLRHDEGSQAYYSHHGHETQGQGNQQVSGQQQNTQAQVIPVHDSEGLNEGYQVYYTQYGHETQDLGMQQMSGQIRGVHMKYTTPNMAKEIQMKAIKHTTPSMTMRFRALEISNCLVRLSFQAKRVRMKVIKPTTPNMAMRFRALEFRICLVGIVSIQAKELIKTLLDTIPLYLTQTAIYSYKMPQINPLNSNLTVLPENSNIYLQLVQDIMQYEWRYPDQSNIPRLVSSRPVVSSSTIKRLQTNTSHPINIVLSELLISESTKNLLWTELESIYQDNPHSSCLQEIQDFVSVVSGVKLII
ncbi:hypothetical protein EV363DRAFT_1299939 [Boletus edulis]|nr:hypothetical protein EV363DRAFT_1299939 [Boletus edulis]